MYYIIKSKLIFSYTYTIKNLQFLLFYQNYYLKIKFTHHQNSFHNYRFFFHNYSSLLNVCILILNRTILDFIEAYLFAIELLKNLQIFKPHLILSKIH